LPHSFLGRAFLTWFNPGPGTGYLFAISNLLAALVLVLGGVAGALLIPSVRAVARSYLRTDEVVEVFTLIFAYVVLYLGLGKLLIGFLRRFATVGIVLAVLLQAMWVLLGCLGPQIIEAFQQPHIRSYSLLYAFDPFSTLANIDRSSGGLVSGVLPIVGVAALAVFLANVPSVVREIRQVRVAKPQRVLEEEAAKKPPPPPKPKSPWD